MRQGRNWNFDAMLKMAARCGWEREKKTMTKNIEERENQGWTLVGFGDSAKVRGKKVLRKLLLLWTAVAFAPIINFFA